MDAIYTEEYKGHKIEIIPDDGDFSPSEWGDDGAFLVHYHRDCWIEGPKRNGRHIITEDDLRAWYQGQSKANPHILRKELAKDYYIFAVSAYIHSGVSLSLESTFPMDSYGWDTSHVGAVLVSKKEGTKAEARKIALGVVNTWNDYLSGNVYGYVIDKDGDSCYGFYGDYEEGALAEARSALDYIVKENRKKNEEKLKTYITNNVPLEKRKLIKE